MNLQRLDKIISSQLNISRSISRTEIRRGKVKVNGETVRDPSLLFNAEENEITYMQTTLNYKKFVYILMNKPKGVLSAATDKTRETVVDLVPKELRRPTLFPVGRLDKDTTGLLIITDDGDFAHRVISPKKNVSKTYKVVLDGELCTHLPDLFESGIVLADGIKCKEAKLEIIDKNIAKVTVTEGRYHQIKRMFGTVGLGVNDLERIALGELLLPPDLEYGECVELSQKELEKILKG